MEKYTTWAALPEFMPETSYDSQLGFPVTALKTMVCKRCHALAEWEEIYIKYISPKEACRPARSDTRLGRNI